MSGEVLAVIGENGAGKSTLMKIMAGVTGPDVGELRMDGKRVRFASPAEAIAAGIALIHQELNLHEHLSVAENLYLGREPERFGWIDRAAMTRSAAEQLARVGLPVAAQTELGELSTAARQLVEVAKALSAGARVVIMDEPTSSLSGDESERLLALVEQLRRDGVSVIYISHRLGEVRRLADRVVVLRDGRLVGELGRDEIDHDPMVSMMVGRDISQLHTRRPHPPGDPCLEVTGVRVELPRPIRPERDMSTANRDVSRSNRQRTTANRDTSSGIDLAVARGEVVGIAGLVGAGRTELLETIFGIRRSAGGTIAVAGKPIRPGSVRAAVLAGMALVPEDRKRCGLFLESSVRENATLAAVGDAPASPWVDQAWQRRATTDVIARLGVKAASQQAPIVELSGGNQQKVAFGKWWLRGPKVLLLDEPTRGVDVGAKREIYSLLDGLAGEGLAILFVSSEMEEILALADRVVVMHEGELRGELVGEAISEQAIMRLAVGGD